jgi:plastocyanin
MSAAVRKKKERRARRRVVAMILAIAIVGPLAGFALAAEIHTIAQRNRSFDQKSVDIVVGDVVRFTNDDTFLHQIFIASPSLSVDTETQAPGSAIDVRFPKRGSYVVLCHIHPTMRLTVTVK